MHEYEFRILRDDGGSSAVIETVQLGDSAAIRAAQKMAGGHAFEVWRGLDCIHPVFPEHPYISPPAKPSAA
jgi:hypothetical protein